MQRRAATLLSSLTLLALLAVGWGWRRSSAAPHAPLQRGASQATSEEALQPAALAPGAPDGETEAPSASREARTAAGPTPAAPSAPGSAATEESVPSAAALA